MANAVSRPLRAILFPVVLLSALASTPSVAQPSPPSVDLAVEADLQFELGVAAYSRRQYRAALEHLLRSNRLVPNVNVVFNIARTYEQLGDPTSAWAHYSHYATTGTDPARAEQSREAMLRLAPRVALVYVETDPPGAQLYVNRQNLGTRGVTPRDLALPPGDHTIILEAPGYKPAKVSVRAIVGSRVRLQPELTPVLGTVRVVGSPEGAEIRVGSAVGPVVGTLPGPASVPPGPGVLVATKPGYRDAQQVVDVPSNGDPVEVRFALEPLTAALVVRTAQKNVLIEVDGVPAGFSPAVIQVPTGTHTIRLSRAGMPTVERVVEVGTGANELVVNLRKK